MKTYPSIPDNYAQYWGRECVLFRKEDGSNLRFLWTHKHGWCRYGTRTRLFDASDELYGQAIPIFKEKYADRLTWAIRHDKAFQGAKEVIAFAEFLGPSSFAGEHVLHEPKDLKLFDINIGAKGFMDPFTFKAKFGHLNIPEVLYEGILTADICRSIRTGADKRVFEGAIAKGGERHHLWMVKIKSMLYLNKLEDMGKIHANH